MEAKTNSFEGWAVVELFGHAKAIGFVTTETYGQAVLFRVDTPELPEREFVLQSPQYTSENGADRRWTPAGSKVRRQVSPAATRLVGPGAIYSIVPCTEETARQAIERLIERPLILLELAKTEPVKITWPEADAPEDRCCEECGNTPEDGHAESCSFAVANEEEV